MPLTQGVENGSPPKSQDLIPIMAWGKGKQSSMIKIFFFSFLGEWDSDVLGQGSPEENLRYVFRADSMKTPQWLGGEAI